MASVLRVRAPESAPDGTVLLMVRPAGVALWATANASTTWPAPWPTDQAGPVAKGGRPVRRWVSVEPRTGRIDWEVRPVGGAC